MENEPERKWNKEMHSLIREMLHYVNSLEETELCDAETVSEFEARYDRILNDAMEEYEYIPCSDYYREGFNLAKRMQEFKAAHLLFLKNRQVPATNNKAERMLRTIKRKAKQAVTFRSLESIEYLSDSMSVLYSLSEEGGNLYREVTEIFG